MPGPEIRFDTATHSADAIQRAAYKFCARFALEMTTVGDVFQCRLHPLDTDVISEDLVNDFRVEVLDQVLRERIRNETEAIRNLILSLAFSNTSLLEDEQ